MEIMLKGETFSKCFVKGSLKTLFYFFLLWNWIKTQKKCHVFRNKIHDFHKNCPAAIWKNLVPNIIEGGGRSRFSCENGVEVPIGGYL